MRILKNPEVLSVKAVEYIQERKNAVFVCDTCLRGPGGWINSPVAVFYNKDPANVPPGGSLWFGMFHRAENPMDPDSKYELYITNAISAVQDVIVGVRANNDDIVYSRCRHDYRMSPDGSAMIDGGRDYIRTGPFGKGTVELQIIDGELVIAEEPEASTYRLAINAIMGESQ